MRGSFLMPVFGAVAMLAAPASAVSFISGAGAISLDRTDDFSWIVNYVATAGTDLPGTTGAITFNFLSANAGGTVWNFSYSVDNTSVAPSAGSRLVSFGFDTTGAPTNVSEVGADFNALLNSGNFNGLGTRDVCFYAGPNCNGGGNAGVTAAQAPAGGTFSLTFGNGGLQTLVLDQFVARWQSTGATQEGSNSGGGTIQTPPIPEPATWALMIGGFALTGAALRRRKTIALSYSA